MWISLSLKILKVCYVFGQIITDHMDKYSEQIIFKGLNAACVILFHSINNRYWPLYTNWVHLYFHGLNFTKFETMATNPEEKFLPKMLIKNIWYRKIIIKKFGTLKIDAMLNSLWWQIFTNSKSDLIVEHETNDLKLCKMVDVIVRVRCYCTLVKEYKKIWE